MTPPATKHETSQTDANNHTTTFTFDPNGDQLTRTLPDGEEESSTYNLYNQVATHVDFDGNTATYTYLSGSDPNAGSLYRVVYVGAPNSGKTTETITYTYTDLGQQRTVTDASGTTTLSYDPEGDVIEQDTPEGIIHHAFDPATGQLIETWTNFTDIAYGYSPLGELKTTTVNKLNGQTLSAPLVTTDYYDPAGNKKTETLPDGEQTTWNDDDLNRLLRVSEVQDGAVVFAQTFVLNDDGTRASSHQVQLQPGGSTLITTDTTWHNDAPGRLTSETLSTSDPTQNYTDTFSYDLVGNRLQSQHAGPGNGPDETINNTYNGDDELTKEVAISIGVSTETDLKYDANGSLTTSGPPSGPPAETYGYDVRNKMVSANATTYVYDDAGNRVGETTSGVTTFYLTDDANPTGYAQPIEQKASAAAAPTITYIIGDRVLAQVDSSGAVSYLLTDGHGSTRALTNSAGTVTQTFNYTAVGGALGFNPSAAGTIANTTVFLFGGDAVFDPASGLYLHGDGARPRDGFVFTQIDPRLAGAGDLANANVYLYVGGNPLNMADPTGRDGLAETMAATGIANMINGLEFTAFSAVHQTVRGVVLGESANQVVISFLISQAIQVGAMVGLAGLGSIVADLRDGSLFASDILQNGEGPLANAAASDAIGGLAPVTPLAADAPISPGIVNAINGGGQVVRGEENCVACSIAVELHFRGTPASALPGAGPSLGDELVQLSGNDFTDVSSAADLTGTFQGFGDGARGVAVYRLPNGKMHAINVINSGGRVWYIDAQAGGEAVLDGISDVCYVRTH